MTFRVFINHSVAPSGLGAARLVFNLAPAKADQVLPVLDRCADLMRRANA